MLEAWNGVEIVDTTARLCAMNLYLHGIGGENSPVRVAAIVVPDKRRRGRGHPPEASARR